MRGALSLTPPFYEALRRLTLELAGVKLGTDHAFLVETRLAGLAREEGFETLDAMVRELFNTGQTRLAIRVVSALVERDTHFFREPASLNTLFDGALSDLAAKRGGGRIDVLCHGCGSGQEVYSIAIQAARYKTLQGHPLASPDIHVTGIDYPSQALERAEAGRYSHFDVQRGLPVRDLVQHFTQLQDNAGDTGGDWVVNDALRARTHFKGLHMLSGLEDIGKFHAISFRGFLSHYSAAARLRVIRSLVSVLRPNGYLVIASHETLGRMALGLEQVDGHPNLFRKKSEPVPDTPPPPAPETEEAFIGPVEYTPGHRPRKQSF